MTLPAVFSSSSPSLTGFFASHARPFHDRPLSTRVTHQAGGGTAPGAAVDMAADRDPHVNVVMTPVGAAAGGYRAETEPRVIFKLRGWLYSWRAGRKPSAARLRERVAVAHLSDGTDLV